DGVGSGEADGLSLGVALAEVSLSPDGCEVDGAPSLGAGPVGEVQPTAPSSTALSSAAPPVQCRAIRWRRPTAPALPRSSRIEVVIITEGTLAGWSRRCDHADVENSCAAPSPG